MARRRSFLMILPGRALTIRLFLTVLGLQAVVCLLVVATSRYLDTSRLGISLQIHNNFPGDGGGKPAGVRPAETAARPKFKRPSHKQAAEVFSKLGINISYVHIEPVIPVPSKMSELKESLKENALPGVFQIYRNDNQSFSFADPPPFVILTATDKNFIDLTENWRESMRRLGLKYEVLLMAEDDETYDFFFRQTSREFRTVLSSQFSLPGNLAKNISTYQHLIRRRTVYILTILQSGHDVLLVDIDAVWFKDPVKLVLDEYDKHDIWLAQGKEAGFPCPCFFYMKSTERVMMMVYDWIERLAYYQGKTETDQVALSHILTENKRELRINYLDYFRFPIGKQFFNWTWHDQYAAMTYVAHGNHLGRSDGKVSTFREFKVWLLDD